MKAANLVVISFYSHFENLDGGIEITNMLQTETKFGHTYGTLIQAKYIVFVFVFHQFLPLRSTSNFFVIASFAFKLFCRRNVKSTICGESSLTKWKTSLRGRQNRRHQSGPHPNLHLIFQVDPELLRTQFPDPLLLLPTVGECQFLPPVTLRLQTCLTQLTQLECHLALHHTDRFLN